MRSLRRKSFWIFTVLFIILMIFCVKGTAMSMGNRERARENCYYADLEHEYVEKTHSLLEKKGYDNCGVNMTRVTYEDGSREYTILLHHRKLDRLTKEEKVTLMNLLSEAEFRDEICSFRYDL